LDSKDIQRIKNISIILTPQQQAEQRARLMKEREEKDGVAHARKKLMEEMENKAKEKVKMSEMEIIRMEENNKILAKGD
jgi:hypothetical protein